MTAATIQRSEIISMQTSLWGNANGLRPMERFIFTHTQVDVAGYMKDDSLFNLAASDCKRLRQRYWIEVRLREKNGGAMPNSPGGLPY